jgi:hypothetical protein
MSSLERERLISYLCVPYFLLSVRVLYAFKNQRHFQRRQRFETAREVMMACPQQSGSYIAGVPLKKEEKMKRSRIHRGTDYWDIAGGGGRKPDTSGLCGAHPTVVEELSGILPRECHHLRRALPHLRETSHVA